VPFLGKFARRYAGIIATPSSEVDSLLATVDTMDELFKSWDAEKEIQPQNALSSFTEINRNVDNLESKIQSLIIISPELQANPEEVDNIETQLLILRNKLRNSREQILIRQGLR